MPPKQKLESRPTVYEISRQGASAAIDEAGARQPSWEPVGRIETVRGALYALRFWAEQQGDKFAGGRLRAVPVSNITEREITVETKRQLTLGAP